MKRVFSLLLALMLCFSMLVACQPVDEEDPTDDPDDKVVEYDLESAASYLEGFYEEDNPITSADYTLVSQVMVAGVVYPIEWSVNSDKVTVGEVADYKVTIGVDEKSSEEVAYQLTATIKAGDGTSTTVTFDRIVPKYAVNSHAEYMAAQKGDQVTVEGIVVAINSKALGNKYNHLFLADASLAGGYYCYSITADPEELGIKVGMTVKVAGPMEPYSGMQEIKGGQASIIDQTIKTVEPVDITAPFTAGENLGVYVGMPVVIKGVSIGTQDLVKDTSQYLYFNIGEQSGYVRTYVTDFPTSLPADTKGAIDADHAEHFGYTADATGILILYNGAPYLIPMSATPFTNYTFVEKTPADKIEAEADNLSVTEAVTENTTMTLPTVGNFYEDVTITWAVDNDAFSIEDGKMAVQLGEEKITLTLTATITCEDAKVTKTFTVKVDAASKDVYVPKAVSTPVDGVAYKFFLTQGTLGKDLYLTGEVSGRYLVTTDKADQAIDVYAETVDGGFKFYIVVGEEKQYITVYNNADGKLSVKYDAAGTSVYTYNATTKAWATNMDGTDYYLGTYSNFNTVSASKTSYITAENTGISQFPAGLATLAPAAYAPTSTTTPAADTAYKFALVQGTLGKTLYITGEVNGRYLSTTDKVDQAIDVYAEAVDGGFKFYIVVGEEKQYITVYNNADGKLSVKFDAAGTSVYTYDATTKAWATNMDGTDYYLGTYSNFNTVSASKTSYITAENTGVSQFPAGVYTMALKEVAPVATTAPAADTAYKFSLVQSTLGKTLYITGEVSGRYLSTTDKISRAADVYAEAVEGGYKFYIVVGEEKQYITVYNNADGKLSVKFDAAGTSVYTYDATTHAWATNMDGTNYYLGTYSNFNTVSASKTSYITAENTGVSQFPAGPVSIEFVNDTEAPEAPVEPETPETPEEPAGPVEVTIPQANAAADGTEIIVKGTVKEINTAWSEQYGNITVTIADGEGNTLYVYRMKTNVKVGDVIKITGKMGSYNGAKQVAAGATAEILEAAPVAVSLTEAVTLADGTNVIVKGTVKEINTAWSEQYGNITVTIEDGEGNTLYIYRMKTNVKVGDVVTITGKMGSYNGAKQVAAGATAVIEAAGSTEEPEVPAGPAEVTIPEANAAADGTEIIVKGTVKEINTAWSEQYGNITVTIEDGEGNTLYVYRMKTNVKVGDVIKITGKMGSYNGAKQVAAGATAEILEAAPVEVSLAEAVTLADGTKVIVVGTVKEINTAWSEQYGNITVTIEDANGDTLYIYRMKTNVNVGDEVKITGKMGSYNGAKQIAAGATAIVYVPVNAEDFNFVPAN